MPKLKIKTLIKTFILRKKWIIVITSDINISPKKISRKKFFLILKLTSLPYPEIDNARKVILTINITKISLLIILKRKSKINYKADVINKNFIDLIKKDENLS